MVNYKVKMTEEIRNFLMDLTLESSANKKRRNSMRILLTAVGLAEMIMGFLMNSGAKYFAFAAGILMLVFAIKAKSFQKYLMKKAEQNGKADVVLGDVNYEFKDDGVDVSSEFGNSHYNWNVFEGYGVRDIFIYLKLNDGRIIPIDQNDISEEDREELIALVSTNCKKL